MDKFRVERLSATPNPQQTVWAAMHQDYSEDFVWDGRDRFPSEAEAGSLIIKHLLAGDRGHFGPLEHPQIVVNVGYFPHSMMQQLRTHRVGVSFDVQCLAADTAITFVHASGRLQKFRIADLYDLWENGERAVRERKIRGRQGEPPGQYRRDCKRRLQKMNLRVLNESTGFFETSHLRSVTCSGKQPVYRLTLADGKTLDCTTNHRLLTADGWQHMGEALGLVTDADHRILAVSKSCQVMCNGIARLEALYTQKAWFADCVAQGLTAREIAARCGCSADVVPKGRQLAAHPVAVVRVEYLGMQMTYDLEVAEPWHNFVANGVVVHNSFRYSGQRIIDVTNGKRELEAVFYLRSVGKYTNRQGKRYEYTSEQRQADLDWCRAACDRYRQQIEAGMSEEHARSLIPFDTRQHFVLSCNARSLMHLLDLRWKKDAQLEIQAFSELLFAQFETWMPAIAAWYAENRAKKAKLSP